MNLLTWWAARPPRIKGWALHAGMGCLFTLCFALLGDTPLVTGLTVYAIGIAHEIGDGDFLPANGGPLNGVYDTLAFLPGPIVWLLIQAVR